MVGAISRTQSNEDVVLLEVDGVIADPALRLFAECIRELRPSVDACSERRGHGVTLAALVSIVTNDAIDDGVAGLIADAFRQNAELLVETERRSAVAGRA